MRPSDEPGIARLHRGTWAASVEDGSRYLAWKYRENPYVEDPLVFVAVHGGEVVAMRALSGAAWEVPGSGEIAVAPCAADLVIHPDHRDRGLYEELNQLAIEAAIGRGYHHLFNLSANPENYVTLTVGQGWKPVGSLEILTRRTATGSRVAKVVPRIAASDRLYALARRGLAAGRRLRSGLNVDPFRSLDRASARSGGRDPITVSSEPRPAEMAAVIAATGSHDRIRHVRDEGYLSWRYRNPRATYRFVTWGRLQTEAYLVLQNIPGRIRTAIADWEAPDPEVREHLLDFVTREGKLASLRIWSATLDRTDLEALRARGFHPTFTDGMLRYAGRMLTRPLAAAGGASDPFAGTDVTQIDNWDLRMIYSDAL